MLLVAFSVIRLLERKHEPDNSNTQVSAIGMLWNTIDSGRELFKNAASHL